MWGDQGNHYEAPHMSTVLNTRVTIIRLSKFIIIIDDVSPSDNIAFKDLVFLAKCHSVGGKQTLPHSNTSWSAC